MTVFNASSATGVYRIESSFDEGDDTTAASGTEQIFGKNFSIDTFEGVNNAVEVFEFSERTPTEIVEQNFEGSYSVSFVLAGYRWLELFNDTDSGPSGTADILETGATTIAGTPTSFEIEVQREDAASGTARVITGCVPTGLTIEAQTDGSVQVTISGAYANEYIRTSGLASSQPLEQAKVVHYGDVTLDPSTTDSLTYSLPQGFTLDITNSITLIDTLGSRTASDFSEGTLTATLDLNAAVEVDDTTSLEAMYGASTGVTSSSVSDDETVTIEMDNGETGGTDEASNATWSITGLADSYSESGLDVQEDLVTQSTTAIVKSLTVDVDDAGAQQ